jgi:hypothetical protein
LQIWGAAICQVFLRVPGFPLGARAFSLGPRGVRLAFRFCWDNKPDPTDSFRFWTCDGGNLLSHGRWLDASIYICFFTTRMLRVGQIYQIGFDRIKPSIHFRQETIKYVMLQPWMMMKGLNFICEGSQKKIKMRLNLILS